MTELTVRTAQKRFYRKMLIIGIPVYTVTLFGLYSGAAVYTAQYWGAKDIAGVRRMLGIDYAVGFIFALVVSVAAFVFAPNVIQMFSEDEMVIKLGVDYLRIACFSYVFSGMS